VVGKPLRLLAAAALALSLASSAAAQPTAYPFSLEGRVVGVTDGDTIKILVGERQHKIRLNGIDAPEMGQAYGRKSKDRLAALVAGKKVEVLVRDTDRYGRYVGDVLVDGKSAGAELVAVGLAWHYLEYSKDERLAALEKAARAQRLGLWADPRPIAPWDYRRHKREKAK
jgi:endonuclease YncB( thermonuclease family)